MVHSDDKNEDIILALMMGRYIQWTWGPGTWDLGPGTWDLGPGTWDLGPGTWDLGPGTWDLGPGTQGPELLYTVRVYTQYIHSTCVSNRSTGMYYW